MTTFLFLHLRAWISCYCNISSSLTVSFGVFLFAFCSLCLPFAVITFFDCDSHTAKKKTKTNIIYDFYLSAVKFLSRVSFFCILFVAFLCVSVSLLSTFFRLFLLRRIHWKPLNHVNAIKNFCADRANKLKNASKATLFFLNTSLWI